MTRSTIIVSCLALLGVLLHAAEAKPIFAAQNLVNFFTEAEHKLEVHGVLKNPLCATTDRKFAHISDLHVDYTFTDRLVNRKQHGKGKIARPPSTIDTKNQPASTCVGIPFARKMAAQNKHEYRFGVPGYDSTAFTMLPILHDIKKQCPSLLLISGDVVPHSLQGSVHPEIPPCMAIGFSFDAVLDTIRSEVGAKMIVAYALGNNDMKPKNTVTREHLAVLHRSLKKYNMIAPQYDGAFLEHGGHVVSHDSWRIVCVNGNNFLPTADPVLRDKHLQWIHEELKSIHASKHVPVLMCHQQIRSVEHGGKLQKNSVDSLVQWTHDYDVHYVFVGDVNVGDVRVLEGNYGSKTSMFTVPGIAPRARNNPSYNLYTFDPKEHNKMSEYQLRFYNVRQANKNGNGRVNELASYRDLLDYVGIDAPRHMDHEVALKISEAISTANDTKCSDGPNFKRFYQMYDPACE